MLESAPDKAFSVALMRQKAWPSGRVAPEYPIEIKACHSVVRFC